MSTQNNEYEHKITELIAKTYHFEQMASGNGYVCKICLKRLMAHYAGKPINERMIQHFENYHERSV